jgi:hypothetical protein
MPFEPFGYRFEIKSSMSSMRVRTVVRAKKKPWFEPKNGARGWIVGPFICLWFTGLNSQGPMLFGRIAADGSGSRIYGRAGSDLNGVLASTLATLLAPVLLCLMIRDGAPAQSTIFFGLVFLSVFSFVLWGGSAFKRDAEPLERFLKNAVSAHSRFAAPDLDLSPFAEGFSLNAGGEVFAGPVTAGGIYDALSNAGSEDFVVLARAPETYIQTVSDGGCYIIERRDGSYSKHFSARRLAMIGQSSKQSMTKFTFEEVLTVFMAFASETAMPKFIDWEVKQFTS